MNPDAASVDRHVVIVTAAGSFTAAGERLTGPVDAVDKLEKLIDWAHQRGGLQPLRDAAEDADPEPARVWLVGGACGAAGRLRGRGGRGGDRADRSGVGAAGHTRMGTACQAHDGPDADAQSRRTTTFRRDPRRAAALAGRRLSLGGRGSGSTRTPATPVVCRGGHAARRERCRLGRGPQRPHHARPRRASRRRRVDTRGAARLGAAGGADSARVVRVGGRGGTGVRAVRRTGMPSTTMPTAGLGRDAEEVVGAKKIIAENRRLAVFGFFALIGVAYLVNQYFRFGS